VIGGAEYVFRLDATANANLVKTALDALRAAGGVTDIRVVGNPGG
jgi:hypothetical protein